MYPVYIQTKPDALLIDYVCTIQNSLFLELFLLIQQTQALLSERSTSLTLHIIIGMPHN